MRNGKKKAMEKVPVAREVPLMEVGNPKVRKFKF